MSGSYAASCIETPNLNMEDHLYFEIIALIDRQTWELVPHPTDGSIAYYKACLVTWGFSQTCGIDDQKTFSLMVKLNSIWVLLSLVVHHMWSLPYLYISNALFYGDLYEKVLMEKVPR